MQDFLVITFVAALVFAAFRIPSLGDAIGRLVRGRDRAPAEGGRDDATPPRR